MATAPDTDAFFRELLASVVEMAPDLIYYKNRDHEFEFVGDTYVETVGECRADILGKTAWDLWPDAEAESIIADEKRALAGDPVVGRERKVTHPDGSTHWYEVNKLPRFENDEVIGFFAIDREITDRKRKQRELERYQAFVEHSGDIIALVTEDGLLEYASPAVEEHLGYTQAGFAGKRILQFVHPEDIETVEAAFNQLIAEPYDLGSIEFRLRDASGEWIWMEASGVHRPQVDGIEGILLVAREISDRKAKEREWQRMKRAVDASGHAIYITDPEGQIEYVNPAFEAATGYPAEEAVGRNPRIMKSGLMDETYYERLWETILDGDVWDEEIINRRKSGEQYTAQQTIAPIHQKDSISAFVAIQTDITDRIELEERLSVVNRILRHDIRSAVGVIRGNAKLGLESRRDLEDVLETIRAEANRLHRLGENARYLEGALSDGETETGEIDLAELVTVTAFELRDDHPEATIEYDVPQEASVTASKRLSEAITELVTNAIVHNDDDPSVELTVEKSGDAPWTVLTVTDDGPGIPKGEIDPLEEGMESSLEHSSGLGLWVVHWIVEESGGELEFTDDECEGSTIRVRLPSADKA